MMKEFRIGVTALVLDGEKVLLGKRLQGRAADTWGFPGGHVEIGEQLAAAAARELQEETGLIVDSLEFIGVANYPDQDHHWVHINFLVTQWHGELENREPEVCGEWKWFSLDALPENITPFHAYVLPMYKERTMFMEV